MVNVPPFTGVPPVGAFDTAPLEAEGEPDAVVAAFVDVEDDPDAAVELDPLCVVAVEDDPLPQAARTQPIVENERPSARPRVMMSRRDSR
jgi:hypothetical protein